MKFKAGVPRAHGAGIKKGQKQARTMLREQLEERGIVLVDKIMELLKDANTFDERHKALSLVIPYCMKKMPTDVEGDFTGELVVTWESRPL
jgi:hypothetical protein